MCALAELFSLESPKRGAVSFNEGSCGRGPPSTLSRAAAVSSGTDCKKPLHWLEKKMLCRFGSFLFVAALSGCTTTPLGSGLLVHPETDENGVGMVKYRVGGYDSAKQQMFRICGYFNDVQITGKEISASSVEETAVYGNTVAASGAASSADVSTGACPALC